MDVTIGSGKGSGVDTSGSGSGKGKPNTRRQRNNKKQPRREQRFANYLVFGFTSTLCLGLFLLCYILVLVILWPLLEASTPDSMPDETARDYIHHMHVPPSLTIAHVPGKEKLGEVTSNIRKKLTQFRQGRGVTDANLLDQAVAAYESHQKENEFAHGSEQNNDAGGHAIVAGNHRNGFIILGMHRSGTSMLGGLLHKSAGYIVGGPLIGSSFDNEMGFFERIDIVLQNDEFMIKQNIIWAANVLYYDWKQALKDKESGEVTFKEGNRGLPFLNNPNNAPWMQKDPRMCITLKTWLKLMNNEPAIVFTYRHPLEVALSINKREDSIAVESGLRLWIVYNMRAIQNSRGLCIVRSSNDAILADPLHEVQRITDELTSKCDVPPPPNRLTQEEINKLIDPKLQHNKKKANTGKEVIETYNDGKCTVHSYISEEKEGTPQYKREHSLYLKAMKIYCDLQSGVAHEEDYVWPKLT
jgi:hypothetical protein